MVYNSIGFQFGPYELRRGPRFGSRSRLGVISFEETEAAPQRDSRSSKGKLMLFPTFYNMLGSIWRW
jgi:hypothetical protein